MSVKHAKKGENEAVSMMINTAGSGESGENGVFMSRVEACAWIEKSNRPAKILDISENATFRARLEAIREERATGNIVHAIEKIGVKVSIDVASKMYVLGALKASVRRGSALTIAKALEQYEDNQIGDRQTSVKGESPLLREVRRIDAINEVRGTSGTKHVRSMGKVLGTLYVEYDASQEASAIDVTIEREGFEEEVLHMDSTIAAYIAEYVTRLSDTARASIHAIVASAHSVDDIVAGASVKADKAIRKLNNTAQYLNISFAHGLSTREYIDMMRKYVPMENKARKHGKVKIGKARLVKAEAVA
jgi:hypothetical protein